MIQIKNLTKTFHQNTVLNDISFDILPGQVVAIIGSSGAGKSTLLRSLNFLEQGESGTIQLNNFHLDIAQAKKVDILQLRKLTAMVFQQFNLFQQKTALENVMEGLVIVKGLSKQEAKKIAEQHAAYEALCKIKG